jgi:hypothetical protein
LSAEELALAHHRPVQIEPRELPLDRPAREAGDVVHQPVVERAVVLELQRAEGVGDALDGIAQGMRVVIHRIHAPGVAGAVMLGVEDAVDDRIAHVDVGMRHVDLGAQRAFAVPEPACAHAPEEVEVLRRGAVAEGAVSAGLGERATMRTHFLGAEIADEGEALADELFRETVELFEIVARVEKIRAPVEAEPLHVLHDGVDVFGLLLGGIGVVEAEVAAGVGRVLLRDAEVQADGLRVADVEVAVRFRGKAGDDHPAVFTLAEVAGDDLADEVEAGLGWGAVGHGQREERETTNYKSQTARCSRDLDTRRRIFIL